MSKFAVADEDAVAVVRGPRRDRGDLSQDGETRGAGQKSLVPCGIVVGGWTCRRFVFQQL